MSIAQFLAPVTGEDGPIRLNQAANWMQGRTLYGGASALLAYTHIKAKFADLPPLRSAQIGFVAPVGENIELSAQMVRQGRNVIQIRSEITNEGQSALTGLWLFGAAREANARREAAPPENWPGAPQDNAPAMAGKGPAFVQKNFELRHAQAQNVDHGAVIRRWARLVDDHDLDPVSQCVLMGDVMPPGALRIVQRLGPISSINWSFNVLETDAVSPEGWYLTENASHHADYGYSSERLRMWDTTGRQVLDGLQCVAVFG